MCRKNCYEGLVAKTMTAPKSGVGMAVALDLKAGWLWGLFYITDLWDRHFKESNRFTDGFFCRYWPAEHARNVYEG